MTLASSLVYVPFTSTNCESESGECSYRVIEIPCDNEECDPDTGLCPNGVIPTFDAGPNLLFVVMERKKMEKNVMTGIPRMVTVAPRVVSSKMDGTVPKNRVSLFVAMEKS